MDTVELRETTRCLHVWTVVAWQNEENEKWVRWHCSTCERERTIHSPAFAGAAPSS